MSTIKLSGPIRESGSEFSKSSSFVRVWSTFSFCVSFSEELWYGELLIISILEFSVISLSLKSSALSISFSFSSFSLILMYSLVIWSLMFFEFDTSSLMNEGSSKLSSCGIAIPLCPLMIVGRDSVCGLPKESWILIVLFSLRLHWPWMASSNLGFAFFSDVDMAKSGTLFVEKYDSSAFSGIFGEHWFWMLFVFSFLFSSNLLSFVWCDVIFSLLVLSAFVDSSSLHCSSEVAFEDVEVIFSLAVSSGILLCSAFSFKVFSWLITVSFSWAFFSCPSVVWSFSMVFFSSISLVFFSTSCASLFGLRCSKFVVSDESVIELLWVFSFWMNSCSFGLKFISFLVHSSFCFKIIFVNVNKRCNEKKTKYRIKKKKIKLIFNKAILKLLFKRKGKGGKRKKWN